MTAAPKQNKQLDFVPHHGGRAEEGFILHQEVQAGCVLAVGFINLAHCSGRVCSVRR